MRKLFWAQLLAGLRPEPIRGDIYRVKIKILGDSEVGPYAELLDFVKRTTIYKLPVDVHHIVNGEHLDGTGWSYLTAPSVVLERGLHQQYHGRFSQVLPDYHGRDILDEFPVREKLELYHDMFVEQTGWSELWTIAARVLTGSVTVPRPETFRTR